MRPLTRCVVPRCDLPTFVASMGDIRSQAAVLGYKLPLKETHRCNLTLQNTSSVRLVCECDHEVEVV